MGAAWPVAGGGQTGPPTSSRALRPDCPTLPETCARPRSPAASARSGPGPEAGVGERRRPFGNAPPAAARQSRSCSRCHPDRSARMGFERFEGRQGWRFLNFSLPRRPLQQDSDFLKHGTHGHPQNPQKLILRVLRVPHGGVFQDFAWPAVEPATGCSCFFKLLPVRSLRSFRRRRTAATRSVLPVIVTVTRLVVKDGAPVFVVSAPWG